jgi:hypothetical protein
MERAMSVRKIVLAAVFAASGVAATAQEAPKPPASKVAANARPEARRALFGELHLHTTMSFDAWTFGTKVTPDTGA